MLVENHVTRPAIAGIADVARIYEPVLRRFFERRIIEHADAEDLVQEVFLRLTRHGDLGDVTNVEGYLFQTAANILRDQLRQRVSRHAQHHEPIDHDHDHVEGGAYSPERVLQGREAMHRLSQALLALPERTRAVFILCRIDGLPHAEVATGLGTSLSTVNKHLARAMDELTRCMREVL
jgi:RNA polymerase sigma factor (sigma-70 family)